MYPPRLTSILALGVLALALDAAAAHAADSSVDIEIVGIVPESCSIAVDNGRSIIDLASNVRQFRIATVTESCNRAAGYTVTVRSSQNGLLSSSGGGSIGYSVTYGGQDVDLSEGMVLERSNQTGSEPRDLLVSVPEGDRSGGVYRDVITIEISAQ